MQYAYDPYGRATKLQGSFDADFQYAGYYMHAPSGLNLTMFRAYNPTLGRWLSRDPIGEESGSNLYQYAFNNPLSFIDPMGLDAYILDKPFSVVGPLGHIGEMYGDSQSGYDYYTFTSTGHSPIAKGQLPREHFNSLDEAWTRLYADGYRRALHIPMSETQDALGRGGAESWNGRMYCLVGASCSNNALDSLRRTGIPAPHHPSNFLPRMAFKNLLRDAEKGKLGKKTDIIQIKPSKSCP